MARRSASPLLALARAYQRNVRALARAARLARPPAAALLVSARKRPKARKPAVPKRAQPAAAALGQWLAGIAPGPAGARRYHLYVPPGVSAASRTRLPLVEMSESAKAVLVGEMKKAGLLK